jgi:hypothetical protein
MNEKFNSILEIRKFLRDVSNDEYTAESLAQELQIKLDKTLKSGLEILPLSDTKIDLKY